MSKKNKMGVLAAAVGGLSTAVAGAAPITAGDLVVYRVGDGTQTLANTGNSVFVDEYTPAGTLVQSIAAPTAAAAGTVNPLIASGTAGSEGLLTVSPNGRFVALTGYDAPLGGTANLAGTSSGVVSRTVGLVNVATGTIDTSTALNDFATGNNPRGAIYDGTNLYLTGGAGGLRTATVGATTSTQLSTTSTNLRQVNIAAGQLFVTSSSGAIRLATVGTGTSTATGQTITNLPGVTSTNSASPYGFFFADLSPTLGFAGTTFDTVYVADSTNGISKFGYDGTNFNAEGTVADAGVTGLAGSVAAGGIVSLYASNGAMIQSLTDATGTAGTLAGTPATVVTAGNNVAFRGVALVTAVPEPTTSAAAAAVIAVGVLGRRTRKA